jgi:hypothetical protein
LYEERNKIMEIGPVEYIVISVTDQNFTDTLFAELNAIHETGKIRVVDLIFVTKAADGTVAMQEENEPTEEDSAADGDISHDLVGLLTAEDVEQLTSQIPADTSAVIIVFEHSWVKGLTEVVRQGGGVVYAGGMVSHETLALINEELAATKEAQDA